MRVLLFSRDERWIRYVEQGFQMCRENLEPLEMDRGRDEKDFLRSLQKKQYDVVMMNGELRHRASWGTFFQIMERAWQDNARRKKKYIWHFGRTAVALEEMEIYYLHSVQKEVSVYTRAEGYRISTSMKTEAERLPADRFVRIHRNCLVNMAHIRCMKDNRIILDNGVQLQISTRRRQPVAECLLAYGQRERAHFQSCASTSNLL